MTADVVTTRTVVTVAEAARLAHLSLGTAYERVNNRRWPSFREHRHTWIPLDRLIEILAEEAAAARVAATPPQPGPAFSTTPAATRAPHPVTELCDVLTQLEGLVCSAEGDHWRQIRSRAADLRARLAAVATRLQLDAIASASGGHEAAA